MHHGSIYNVHMEETPAKPREVIERLSDEQFREHLSRMPVGDRITLPVAAYVRDVLLKMYPEERENMGTEMFARNILVFRLIAELGKESMGVTHRLLTTIDPTATYFDVRQFINQVRDRM